MPFIKLYHFLLSTHTFTKVLFCSTSISFSCFIWNALLTSSDNYCSDIYRHFLFIGIEVLLEEGVFEAAYPLHDQLIPEHEAGDPETWNDRMVY